MTVDSATETNEAEGFRLAALEIDGWYLICGLANHLRSPETFEIPTEQERMNLVDGDVVKLIFDIGMLCEDELIDMACERMWVIVRGRSGPYYVGQLDNHPVFSGKELQAGDRVVFLPEHVIDIKDEHFQECCPKESDDEVKADADGSLTMH